MRVALSEAQSAAGLLLLGVLCPLVLIVPERLVPPAEEPSLILPEDAVRSAIAEDKRRAARAPTSPEAERLKAAIDEQGHAEQKAVEDLHRFTERRKRMRESYQALVAAAGEEAALALRAQATERMRAALDLELSAEQTQAVLGAFASQLDREEATHNGYLIAPFFVVRTLYKARWNLLCGLAPDHALSTLEQRTFYGFKGLHSRRLPLPQRIDAVMAYGKAGGDRADEALGALFYQLGDYARAQAALSAAHEARPTLRLRNYLAAASWALKAQLRAAEKGGRDANSGPALP